MARAKKLWRPLKVWRRHEWVPFATVHDNMPTPPLPILRSPVRFPPPWQ